MVKHITKKTIAITLSLVLALGITACQNNKNNTSNDVTVVKVWTGNGHDKAFINEKVEEWNNTIGKEKGIKIEYTVQEGNLSDKVSLAFMSDQAPDLFSEGSWDKYAVNGQIAAIDDLPGGKALLEKYKGKLMQGRHIYNKKTYTLPRSVTTYALLYNKGMFKAAGLVDEKGDAKPPETMQELRECAKKLTNADKKEYGIIFPAKWAGWYGSDINMVASASDGYVDAYNPATGTYDYKTQGELMKTYVGMKEDKSIYPSAEGIDNDPARAKFGLGGIGMKFGASYDFGVLTEQFPAEIDWGVAPIPVLDKDQKGYQYMDASGYLLINKKSVDTVGSEKLLTVYKWFYDDELLKEAFTKGLNIPIDWDTVKEVSVPEKMSNWKKFAELVSISHSCPSAIPSDMTGEDSIVLIWIKIWTREIDASKIDSTVAEYTKKMNDGIKKYQQAHPEYDPSSQIIPDWKAKR